jgi:hypothetical protein
MDGGLSNIPFLDASTLVQIPAAVVLIWVLYNVGKFISKEIVGLRSDIAKYNDDVSKLVMRSVELQKTYLDTVASIEQIRSSLLIAFSRSDIPEYQDAKHILRRSKNKEG